MNGYSEKTEIKDHLVVRPSYVLDIDDILNQVDYMLDILEDVVSPQEYQNCITVLDHLLACDESVYGGLNIAQGRKLNVAKK